MAAHIDAGAAVALPLGTRAYLTSELAAQTHFFSVEDQSGEKALTARFAVRGVLALGLWL